MGQVKQTKRKYTAEEKENAVKTARELGNIALAGRKLNIVYSLLCGWIKATEKAEKQGKTLVESVTENKELLELRKKNKELEEELLIIKKATAYFAQEHLSKNTRGSKK